jgi:hypothetical protein
VTLFYTDVSNNQWGLPWSNWGRTKSVTFLGQLHREGFSGVVHKVSEGSDFADPYWETVREWCEGNNMSWLGYHYVRTDDPNAQAAQFVNNNGGPNAMLDVEDGSGDINNFWNVVNAFNNAGVNVSLAYIPNWYRENIGSPDLSGLTANQISLVSSDYSTGGPGNAMDIYNSLGGDNGPGFQPYGNATPTVWQFTAQATVGPFPNIDCNAYLGTNLDALFTGTIF